MAQKTYHEVLQPSIGLDFLAMHIVDTGSMVPKHFHDALEIVYMLEGEGVMIADGRLMVAGPDQILLVNPREVHHSTAPFGNVNILMQFPLPFLSRLVEGAEDLNIVLPEAAMTEVQEKAWKNFQAACHNMQKILLMPKPNTNLKLTMYALEILDILYTHFSVPKKTSVYKKQSLEKLAPVLDYMQANYSRPISIAEIADVVSLQPEYFCRFFKKCTGTTFLEHLNALRISYIYNDLINSNDPIAQIIERHGFTNYKLFSRMFKERFGASPREIRTQSRCKSPQHNEFLAEYKIKKMMQYDGQWPDIRMTKNEQAAP